MGQTRIDNGIGVGRNNEFASYRQQAELIKQTARDLAQALGTTAVGGHGPHDNWGSSDAESLDAYYAYEQATSELREPPRVPYGAPSPVGRTLHMIRGELPFAEAERHWLFGAYAGLCAIAEFQDSWDLAHVLEPVHAEVLSAGQPIAISGRELLQRWRAWRHSIGIFEDERAGSPAGVIEHLGRLAILLGADLGKR